MNFMHKVKKYTTIVQNIHNYVIYIKNYCFHLQYSSIYYTLVILLNYVKIFALLLSIKCTNARLDMLLMLYMFVIFTIAKQYGLILNAMGNGVRTQLGGNKIFSLPNIPLWGILTESGMP